MRKNTRQIRVGGCSIGGGAPISIQSMTSTDTRDVAATVAQIRVLDEAGCHIVRVAVPDREAAGALVEIRKQTRLPLVADIHFDHRLALEAVRAGVDKVRINPGNLKDPEHVRAVADACRERGIPIRIGVNGGSLSQEILAQYGGVTAQGLVDSALAQMEMLHQYGFFDVCLSLKASHVPMMVEAYRLIAQQTDAPLHIGVTEAGTSYHGIVKSAMGLGALLLDGIGDTLRVSLTEHPMEEVRAGYAILQAAGIQRRGVEVIACPTCGRCRVDLAELVREVEKACARIRTPLRVAVMGCAVNGPGEAREADLGIACGHGEGLLFCRGKIIGKRARADLVPALLYHIEKWEEDTK